MSTIDARFKKFHHDNPEVYAQLHTIARELLALGIERFSIKLCVERLRWERFVATKGRDRFKISNTYTSEYARLLASQESELADVFEMRELRRERSHDELNVEFDDVPISTSSACPRCGELDGCDCWPGRETMESRCGVEFFEGWDSWR